MLTMILCQERLIHKLPLKSPVIVEREGGCEGGFCTYSVVSLMIDQARQTLISLVLVITYSSTKI